MDKQNKPLRQAGTHQPFPVSLESLLVELLDSDDHPCAGPGRGEGVLVDPPFEHEAEASLAEDAVGAEVPGGGPQLVESEAPHVGGLQDLALAARGCGIGIGHGQRGGDTAAPGTGMLLRCAESQTSRLSSSSSSCTLLIIIIIRTCCICKHYSEFQTGIRAIDQFECYMMHACQCQEEIKQQLSFLFCMCLSVGPKLV